VTKYTVVGGNTAGYVDPVVAGIDDIVRRRGNGSAGRQGSAANVVDRVAGREQLGARRVGKAVCCDPGRSRVVYGAVLDDAAGAVGRDAVRAAARRQLVEQDIVGKVGARCRRVVGERVGAYNRTGRRIQIDAGIEICERRAHDLPVGLVDVDAGAAAGRVRGQCRASERKAAVAGADVDAVVVAVERVIGERNAEAVRIVVQHHAIVGAGDVEVLQRDVLRTVELESPEAA